MELVNIEFLEIQLVEVILDIVHVINAYGENCFANEMKIDRYESESNCGVADILHIEKEYNYLIKIHLK